MNFSGQGQAGQASKEQALADQLAAVQSIEVMRKEAQHYRSLAAVLDALAGTWNYEQRAAVLAEAVRINDGTNG